MTNTLRIPFDMIFKKLNTYLAAQKALFIIHYFENHKHFQKYTVTILKTDNVGEIP